MRDRIRVMGELPLLQAVDAGGRSVNGPSDVPVGRLAS